ncbi:hypothetical protein DEH84_02410 [Aquabacterium olei]|uniref:Glycosyltransferase RgtA/B/C/D-like domain-containing protein n=1 Tax=Aquabacterium olei TaxID=1296669 RepID=A0A2U8FN44_9BURK|nr:glycosyltransferase family 39 protein [Aquabacterium olei]AWI52409.1 hypothetical protein DEH84_02410 [Aquabacterium olei]
MLEVGDTFAKRVSFGLFFVIFLYVFFQYAWLTEDAFINFRVLENMRGGQGFVWNPGERVQVFTSALWLFLNYFAYEISGQIFQAAIFLSLLLVSAVMIVFYVLAERRTGLFLLSVSPFLLSRSLRDYMTSGLETPLVMLAITFFVLALVKAKIHRGLWLGLATSMCLLTRHDIFVVVLPFLIFEIVGAWGRPHGWRHFAVGFAAGLVPFLLWTGFSLVYFGLPVPNTARAKVVGGDTVAQSLMYLEYMRHFDPLAYFALAGSLLLQFSVRSKYRFAYLVSIFFFLVYIASVGADYMIGRFFVGPLVLSLALSVHAVRDRSGDKDVSTLLSSARSGLIIVGMLLLLGFRVNNESRYWDARPVFVSGIVDERHVYYGQTDLETIAQSGVLGHFKDNARHMRDPGGIYMACNIGMAVYYADRAVRVIDPLALSDFFLAGLRPLPSARIGHFERPVPIEYIKSLQQERNAFTDARVAAYFNDTLLITRSHELFSAERFRAIYRVLTGAHSEALRLASVSPALVGGFVEVPATEKTSVACAGAGTRVIRFK